MDDRSVTDPGTSAPSDGGPTDPAATAGPTAAQAHPVDAADESAGAQGDPVADAAIGGEPAPAAVPARSTDIVPGPGGVMTDEVGVVTGELTLRTELDGDRVVVKVQYKDADEWYVVTGGAAPLADPAALDAVHQIAVGLLNRPEG